MAAPRDNWFVLGVHEARDNRYPLYGALLAGGQWHDAHAYAAGWQSVTGASLRLWYDGSSDGLASSPNP